MRKIHAPTKLLSHKDRKTIEPHCRSRDALGLDSSN